MIDKNTGRYLPIANPGYSAIHKWLVKNYSNPKKCEKCGIMGELDKNRKWTVHWANTKKHYYRKRDNYIGLCKPCHFRYDGLINNIRHMKMGLSSPNKLDSDIVKLVQDIRLRGWELKDIVNITGLSYPTVQHYSAKVMTRNKGKI